MWLPTSTWLVRVTLTKTSVKSPGPSETRGTDSPSASVIWNSHWPYARLRSVFSFMEDGFWINHQVADSSSVMLLEILALNSIVGLSDSGAHSDTFM